MSCNNKEKDVCFEKIIAGSTRTKLKREFKWKQANDDAARSFARLFHTFSNFMLLLLTALLATTACFVVGF